MAKRNLERFPTLVTYIDPQGKTHAPPDPPLIEGHAPWQQLPNEYRRDKPLGRCPDMKCRRAQSCLSPHYGRFCQRTHMEADEFRGRLSAKLSTYLKLWKIPPSANVKDDGMRELKQALNDREAELEHEALLDWQKAWVEQQRCKAPLLPTKQERKKITSPPIISSPARGRGRDPCASMGGRGASKDLSPQPSRNNLMLTKLLPQGAINSRPKGGPDP